MRPPDDSARLRAGIEDLLASVRARIQAYPPPIPACDAQFNHLLELRAGLPRELERLAAAAAAGPVEAADFLAFSPYGTDIAAVLSGAAG